MSQDSSGGPVVFDEDPDLLTVLLGGGHRVLDAQVDPLPEDLDGLLQGLGRTGRHVEPGSTAVLTQGRKGDLPPDIPDTLFAKETELDAVDPHAVDHQPGQHVLQVLSLVPVWPYRLPGPDGHLHDRLLEKG